MGLTERLLQFDECPKIGVKYSRSRMWRAFAVNICNDHDREFETFRLVNRHQSDDFARFRQRRCELFIGFLNHRCLQSLNKVLQGEEFCAVEFLCHVHQLAQVGDFARTQVLCQQSGIIARSLHGEGEQFRKR